MCLAGIRRKLSPVLVILLFVSFFVIAFHHHDDGDDHPDCPICIAAHVAHSTGINTVSLTISYAISELILPEKIELFSSQFISPLYGRAPPSA
jgi:hypothetical protein